MSFDINTVLKDMTRAIVDSAKEEAGDIKEFAKTILDNEIDSLKDLGEARINKVIDKRVFDREIEREKKVVEAELLTIQIMTKAMAEKATNAAIEIFVSAVKAAIKM